MNVPVRATASRSTRLSYNKLCEIEDFADPRLRKYMCEILPQSCSDSPTFPAGQEHRKLWEVAMAARTLTDFGAVRPDAEILGVGAGREATIYWLTSRVRRVFATDLYLDAGAWEEVALKSMLISPGEYAPCPWNPRRLVVQHMDALDLLYEDDSFDGVFSSSSIEHFGDYDSVRHSIGEIYRVLKPGGVASISTEFRLRGSRPGLPGVLMFDARQVDALFAASAEWEPLREVDFAVSRATIATELGYKDVLAGASDLPHIVLSEGPLWWTSVHLALLKSRSEDDESHSVETLKRG